MFDRFKKKGASGIIERMLITSAASGKLVPPEDLEIYEKHICNRSEKEKSGGLTRLIYELNFRNAPSLIID